MSGCASSTSTGRSACAATLRPHRWSSRIVDDVLPLERRHLAAGPGPGRRAGDADVGATSARAAHPRPGGMFRRRHPARPAGRRRPGDRRPRCTAPPRAGPVHTLGPVVPGGVLTCHAGGVEPNPPPRRRRRAARRPAGPPTDVIVPPTDDLPPTANPHRPRRRRTPRTTLGRPSNRPAPRRAPAGSPGGHPPRPPVDRRPTGADAGRRTRPGGSDNGERSLRSLVTTRSTQVSPTAAMRAREVALPDAADLAAAEAELVIVRRHYVPPTSLTAGRRPDRRGTQGRPGSSSD